ncbi:MAG: hypothetical protein LUI06_09490 [Ruminococcus sp.]|nr:hypothetical protein [Ruminococcus sp.]
MTISDDYAFTSSTLNNDLLYCWDLNSESFDVFCSKPDCKHETYSENNNTSCSAASPGGSFYVYSFLYNESLYSICYSNVNEFTVIKSNTDGTNKKNVLECDITFSTVGFPSFCDGKLLFIGEVFNTDNLESSDVDGEYSLCLLDLDELSYEKIADVGKENECIIGNKSLYLYNDKAYISYSEMNDDSYSDTFESFDLSDGQKTEILKMDSNINISGYDENTMLYSIYDDSNISYIYKLDLETNDKEEILECDGTAYSIYMDDDRLFYLCNTSNSDGTDKRGATIYSLKDKKITKECEFADDQYVYINGRNSSKYIILYQNSEQDSFGILSDEDFWNLDFENAHFCFEQLDY